MDDTEDDARYPPNPYPINFHQTFASSHRPKLPVRNASLAPIDNGFGEEDDEEDEEEEENDEEDEGEEQEQEENPEEIVEIEEEDEDEDEEEEEDDYGAHNQGGEEQNPRLEPVESESKGKQRRSEKLGFELVPRSAPVSASKSSFGRNSLAEWSEQETFILLDAWGDRFLQLGRKSLRSEEWMEVAKKVTAGSKLVRTDTQCRTRLDTLKKKYKKEKLKMAETGNSTTKWVYFKKMEMLLSTPRLHTGLACGLDSGEYVFMNPRVYLNQSNMLDEMRDSPGVSESSEEDSDKPPAKKPRFRGVDKDGGSFRLLADSIQKFGEIYEKIENSKRQQMLELEKMRMEFHRDLELQKRQILERAQAEIVKIRQGDDEIDVSVTNISG